MNEYDPHKNALTVGQLIDTLRQLPDEARDMYVELQGCDCTGPCDGVDFLTVKYPVEERVVLLTRDGVW